MSVYNPSPLGDIDLVEAYKKYNLKLTIPIATKNRMLHEIAAKNREYASIP